MAESNFTKETRKKLWFYRIMDYVLLFSPILIYIITALCNGGVTTEAKVGLVGSVIIAIVLTVFNFVRQKNLRSPIWIILIGLYIAFQKELLPLVIILACTTTLDDLVFTPLIGYYRTSLISSKTQDAREEAEKREREAEEEE